MSHQKRLAIERSWPLPRKGTKYLLKQHPGKKSGISIPLGIILRDILKITNTRKEAKALLHDKEICIDNKIITEEKFPISIFDILSIKKINKSFKIMLDEKGKLHLEEINDKDSQYKTCKIIGKKTLKKGMQQINCLDGRNFLYKDKVNVNDSIVLDLKTGKIIKVLPLKEGAEVFVIGGEHIGETGKIIVKDKKIKIKIKNKDFEIKPEKVYCLE